VARAALVVTGPMGGVSKGFPLYHGLRNVYRYDGCYAPASRRNEGDYTAGCGVIDDLCQVGTDIARAEFLSCLDHGASVPMGFLVYIGVHKL